MMSSFDEMCKKAVKRFIKTVAIIDDEATYNPSQKDKDNAKTVKPPVTGLMTGSKDADSSVTKGDPINERFQDDHDDLSQLDAKVVINAFADIGIACCIQRPENEETPLDRAAKLAATVDVLVIDWALDNENISLPRDIIKKILEEDKNTGGRLRLIVVYTAQSYVDQMIKDLKKDADAVYDNGLDMDEKHFFIKSDCLRIVILNKKTTLNPLKEARIVPFDQLPYNVISEYAELVKGVIPGATLHGIAAIREKTHELLAILNSNLDGAYCLHRAMLPEPSDSVDFAMNLITNEIETIIQTDAQARQIVDRGGLKAWLKQYAGDEKELPYGNSSLSVRTIENCILNGQLSEKSSVNTIKMEYALNLVQAKDVAGQTLKNDRDEEITLSDAEELIRQNNEDFIKQCKPPKVTRFAEALYLTSKDAIYGCNRLSHLQCTTRDVAGRSYFDISRSPTLQLGTILKAPKKDGGEWALCLTPLCDCVRLEEETNFLFLQLYSGKKGHADIIIKMQDGTFVPLVAKPKNKKIKPLTIPFKPINNSKRINAKLWHGEWRIKSSNGPSYQWIGELRYTKALAIANQVAASTSRVGVDDFEWLRSQATLKN